MNFFPHLFQPIRIGRLQSRNRLLMSAMSINFGVDEKGHVTEQLIRYMAARAEGGVGMMLVGGGGVHPTGVELPHLPALWEDDCIPGLKKMARAVKPYAVPLGMQLMHGGRQSYHDRKVAPSAIPAPALAKGPRASSDSTKSPPWWRRLEMPRGAAWRRASTSSKSTGPTATSSTSFWPPTPTGAPTATAAASKIERGSCWKSSRTSGANAGRDSPWASA